MASTNPANFANLPKDELREIAAKGGHASHGSPEHDEPAHADRNPDGTFTKGSELAKELGSKGGHVAHEHQVEKAETEESGRNPDGTFKEGSKLAHDLGVKGGHASHQQ
ncbi:uncharacterized protein K460DRAFT_387949 [Cucurbitaria berberidis CBS 394.84]|uniref:Conidiation-specific protein 10 n=1 Tax=Cucurbitaria berberidis CBS 394.84 TaxID=1168544 RepID=A0A9P4GDP9_9PLEO|nr:uncharacterized protein K460DRAFT_387949 [Cucurbitaria berberidis CBS 394.84]KAF1844023.1 hypothetical protein K460DRAFT_387949 [Cucurbitaria berberidis CBS 394.84]